MCPRVSTQESTRHSETLDAITTFLGYGSYLEWDEDKRIEFLVKELQVGVWVSCSADAYAP